MAESLDNAWQIHAAQMDWTSKSDAKAGFTLTLTTAAAATAVALAADGRIFDHVNATWAAVPYWLALVLYLVSGAIALMAVTPSLRVGRLEAEAQTDFSYFEHARHWDADDLTDALHERDTLPVVGRQIVRMSDIAWRKHRRVAWSIRFAAAGLLSFLLAAGMTIFL